MTLIEQKVKINTSSSVRDDDFTIDQDYNGKENNNNDVCELKIDNKIDEKRRKHLWLPARSLLILKDDARWLVCKCLHEFSRRLSN